ncbi:MAG: DJ-1/PfpI family protein [Acidobacteria bacterium]|nr:DJ-1/PfpI family protein [Acidobacteriota bacterium]
MQVAFLLYDGFTPLDAIGPFQVLASMPAAEPVFVAERAGPITSDSPRCTIIAQLSLDQVAAPEIVVVPGSLTSFHDLFQHEPLLDWLRRVHEQARLTTSVCTGSLLLAAAGLLDGLPATTHWLARDLLATFGTTVVPERVVDTGRIITAAGVSSGIDMALRVVQRIHGDDVARAVQLGIEYDPDPPFDSGSKENAPPAIVAAVSASLARRGAAWIPAMTAPGSATPEA